jgi:hypothetical protein
VSASGSGVERIETLGAWFKLHFLFVPLVCASATTATSSVGSIRRPARSSAAPSNPPKPPSARRNTLAARAEAATSDPCGELSAGSSRQENAGDEQAACTIWSTVREFGSKDRPGPERPDRPHADAHKARRGTPARQTYNGDSARRPAQHCSHAAIIHASAPAPSPRAPWPSPATLASAQDRRHRRRGAQTLGYLLAPYGLCNYPMNLITST